MHSHNGNSHQDFKKSRRDAFNNAARQARARQRKRKLIFPLQLEIDAIMMASILRTVGIDFDLVANRSEFRQLSECWILNLLEYCADETLNDLKVNEFMRFARFIMLHGGSSSDPNTWSDFKNSNFSFTGKIQQILNTTAARMKQDQKCD